MATDYTEKVLDLLAAFGADGFRYYTFASGGFQRTRTHDVGSTGWPWEFLHTWAVPALPATRDALVRQGWIEPLPSGLSMGNEYRVTSKALALLANEATSTWQRARAPWRAYAAAHAAAEADKRAHPNGRQRV